MTSFLKIKTIPIVLVLLVSGCGGGDGGSGSSSGGSGSGTASTVNSPDEEVSSSSTETGPTQQEIEAMATKSLTSSGSSGDFSFSNQRQVSVRLSFEYLQPHTTIEIYIKADEQQAVLLEKGQMQNADLYVTALPIPSDISELHVSLDGSDPSDFIIAINSANVAYHSFDY
ncbi:hypothetical protein L4D20_21325 [Vibrio kyushuensis]|uniref:hypothetical protein n=1 Tax=Vibrio kyushuensis TaxID=2910249 RepID=UPI003D114002